MAHGVGGNADQANSLYLPGRPRWNVRRLGGQSCRFRGNDRSL